MSAGARAEPRLFAASLLKTQIRGCGCNLALLERNRDMQAFEMLIDGFAALLDLVRLEEVVNVAFLIDQRGNAAAHPRERVFRVLRAHLLPVLLQERPRL